MLIPKINVWHLAKDCTMILLGLVLYSVGFCGFILPKGVIMGGLAGVASLIYFQTSIPVAISFYALNIALLAIACRVVGWQFVLKTIFGATFLSVFIGIAQPFFEAYPIALPETFLDCIIGAVLCGTGVGIAFTHNGSTGGTDIVAAMVSKYRQISVGRMILYVDLIIISSSYIMYQDLDRVIYGYVVLVFQSFMTAQVINNNRQAVQFTIFSKKWDEIAESMMAVGQTLANTASSMAENAADNSTGNSTYAYADNGTDGDKGISSHPSKDEERAAKRKELKEKEMTNRKFLAAYRTASRAYTRAEDNLRDMRDNSERYLHLSVEQYCSKIDQIQEEMRALREKIETEYDTRQYKSPLEDWKPDCCR